MGLQLISPSATEWVQRALDRCRPIKQKVKLGKPCRLCEDALKCLVFGLIDKPSMNPRDFVLNKPTTPPPSRVLHASHTLEIVKIFTQALKCRRWITSYMTLPGIKATIL